MLILMAAIARIAFEIFVLVMMAHPVHDTILISSFGCEIKIVMCADENVSAAGIAGIGVENVACPVFVKHAGSR